MGKDWDCFRRRRNPEDVGRDNVFGRTSRTAPASYGESERGRFVEFMSAVFREVYRVLKPGGAVVVWTLPRTSHWTTWAIEDAGFEIRDRIHNLAAADKWLSMFEETLDDRQRDLLRRLVESQASPLLGHLFGQGFPKSLDVSAAIDREAFVHVLFDRVRAHLIEWKRRRGLTNKDLNAAVGSSLTGGGMAGHWTGDNTQPEIPSVDQWFKLKAVLKWPDCDLDRIYAAAKKGKPRPVVGKHDSAAPGAQWRGQGGPGGDITAPATDVAAWWAGWGTALKPAIEPWVLARKPCVGTVARNVMKHGTGALNIDGCRVPAPGETIATHSRSPEASKGENRPTYGEYGSMETHQKEGQRLGRWPTNLVLSHAPGCRLVGTRTITKPDHLQTLAERTGAESVETKTIDAWECVPGCPVAGIDVVAGERAVSGAARRGKPAAECDGKGATYYQRKGNGALHADAGGASRFFPQFHPYRYSPKPKTAEKARGLPEGERNPHPTVKGEDLMRWLVRLVVPAGGRILDPFGGSGSTGVAAIEEGVAVVLIEREPEYARISRARLEAASRR